MSLEPYDEFNLSKEDKEHLADFDEMRSLIAARAVSVADGHKTGVMLTGRAGVSKSFTVKETLKKIGVDFEWFNCQMSAVKLVEMLEEHARKTIVIDDVASLFKDKTAQQVLQACLDGDSGEPRLVTYNVKNNEREFWFYGGLIIISNLPLASDPVSQSIASRVAHLEHEPTEEMIIAFMRSMACKPFKTLTEDERFAVIELIISYAKEIDVCLNLRMANDGFEDFLQDKAGRTFTIDWQTLIKTSMDKAKSSQKASLQPMTKQEEKARDRDLVREAVSKFPNDKTAQLEFTELSKRTFARRWKEVKIMDKL